MTNPLHFGWITLRVVVGLISALMVAAVVITGWQHGWGAAFDAVPPESLWVAPLFAAYALKGTRRRDRGRTTGE